MGRNVYPLGTKQEFGTGLPQFPGDACMMGQGDAPMSSFRLFVIFVAEVAQILNILLLTWLGWRIGQALPYEPGSYVLFVGHPVNLASFMYAGIGFVVGATIASILFCLSEIRKNTAREPVVVETPIRARREPKIG